MRWGELAATGGSTEILKTEDERLVRLRNGRKLVFCVNFSVGWPVVSEIFGSRLMSCCMVMIITDCLKN